AANLIHHENLMLASTENITSVAGEWLADFQRALAAGDKTGLEGLLRPKVIGATCWPSHGASLLSAARKLWRPNLRRTPRARSRAASRSTRTARRRAKSRGRGRSASKRSSG